MSVGVTALPSERSTLRRRVQYAFFNLGTCLGHDGKAHGTTLPFFVTVHKMSTLNLVVVAPFGSTIATCGSNKNFRVRGLGLIHGWSPTPECRKCDCLSLLKRYFHGWTKADGETGRHIADAGVSTRADRQEKGGNTHIEARSQQKLHDRAYLARRVA